MEKIQLISEGLRMLDKQDQHRAQAKHMLQITLRYAREKMQRIGVLEDFERVYKTVENPDEHPVNPATITTFVKSFKLEFGEESSKEKLQSFQHPKFDSEWLNPLDENEVHHTYQRNLDAFKGLY